MGRPRHSSDQTLQVLEALLSDTQRWRHGYELGKELGIKSGVLYPILLRLSEDGLLQARWEPPARPGRPPRHAYRLTALGESLARNRIGQRAPGTARQPRTSTEPLTEPGQ